MDFESGVDRISIVTLAPITADRFIFGSAVGASELMAVLVGAPTLVFADLVFGL